MVCARFDLVPSLSHEFLKVFSRQKKNNNKKEQAKTNKKQSYRRSLLVEQAKILHFVTDLVMIKSRKVESISESTQ